MLTSPAEPVPSHLRRRLGHHILDRRLRLDTMDGRLRAGAFGAVAAIGLAAVLLATKGLPQSHIEATAGGTHTLGEVPLGVLAGCTVILILAWTYLLTGALHGHGLLRVLGLGFYSLNLAPIALVGALLLLSRLGPSFIKSVFLLLTGVPILMFGSRAIIAWLTRQIPILAEATLVAAIGTPFLILWGHGALVWIRERLGLRAQPHLTHRHHIHSLTFSLALGVTAVIYMAAWAGAGTSFFAGIVEVQLAILEIFLIPVLVLSGSDFAEWGEVLGAQAIHLLSRVKQAWALPAAGVIGSALVLASTIYEAGFTRAVVWGGSAALELGILAGLVWLLGRGVPRPTISLPGLVIASGCCIVVEALTFLLGVDRVQSLFWVPVVGAAIIVSGLVPRWSAGCLIVAAAGLTSAYWLQRIVPQGDLTGFRSLFAVWALAAMARRVYRHQHPVGGMVSHLLVAVVVLQVLQWAWNWYNVGHHFGERIPVVGGILVFAAIAWDVLMSGEAVTNVHGRRVPRHSRVMIYTGYAMLTACAIAFNLSFEGNGRIDFGLADYIWPQAGIFLLGLGATLTAFLLAAFKRPLEVPETLIDRSVLADEG
jgi:hypothetical protein